MAGAYDHLIGELQPGQTGWLPLDDNGMPNGPATLMPPPELGAKACSVRANPTVPLPDDEDALYTLTGAPITDHMESNVDRRVTPGEAVPPVLTSISPVSTVINGAAFTLTANGTGFAEDSVVVFDGADAPTTYVSPSQVTAQIQPSSLAGTVDVTVRGARGESAAQSFEFAAARRR